MARPLYQRVDGDTEYTIHECVRRILTPVFNTRSYTYWTPFYFEREDAPQYVKDNVPKGTKIPDWVSPFYNYYGAVFEQGVALRICINYLLEYISMADIQEDLPKEGIDTGELFINPSQYRNYTVSLRYNWMTREQTIAQLAGRTAMCIIPGKYNMLQMFNIWQSIGQRLWTLHPNNAAVKASEKYLDNLEDFLDEQVQVQTFLNITQTILTLQFIGGGLQEVPGLEPAGKLISDTVDNFIDIDKLAELGQDILTDTINDQLNDLRNQVIRSIADLDDKTVFNLDALGDYVNESSRQAINAIDSIISSTYD